MLVEGLKLFLPAGTSALTRERMAHLHTGAAKWQLYELENREDVLTEIDVSDRGNVQDEAGASDGRICRRSEVCGGHQSVRELMPEVEIAVLSAAEIAFRCHGLEFAQGTYGAPAGVVPELPEIVFGVGAAERVLREQNADAIPADRVAASGRCAMPRGRGTILVEDASGTLAGVAGGAGCRNVGRAPGYRLPVFAGAGILGVGPRHDRCLDRDPRRKAGCDRTQGRRGYPSAPARVGLLVAGGVAPCTRRVPAVRIFPGTGIDARNHRCYFWWRRRCTCTRRPTSAALRLAGD